jgi:hypothetical protein
MNNAAAIRDLNRALAKIAQMSVLAEYLHATHAPACITVKPTEPLLLLTAQSAA